MRIVDNWGADGPISQPEAAQEEVLVDFQGFGFTTGGVVFNVTEAELEEIFTPPFMPQGYQGEVDHIPLAYSEDVWGLTEEVDGGR